MDAFGIACVYYFIPTGYFIIRSAVRFWLMVCVFTCQYVQGLDILDEIVGVCGAVCILRLCGSSVCPFMAR